MKQGVKMDKQKEPEFDEKKICRDFWSYLRIKNRMVFRGLK
jgi:hypothetical protein